MDEIGKTFRLTPRKEPRQERARVTVEAILEATARILVHESYEAVNTNRVAEVAGVSVGSLYQYFPSKESMVSELFRQRRTELVDLISGRLMQVADASLDEVAQTLAEAFHHYYQADAALHRKLLRRAPKIGAQRKVADINEEAIAMLASFLESHEQVQATNPAARAFVLWHAVDAVAQQILLTAPKAIEESTLKDQLIALVRGFLI